MKAQMIRDNLVSSSQMNFLVKYDTDKIFARMIRRLGSICLSEPSAQ